ncbi:Uma2 family endonuclease [Micromonospora sp. NPDC048999]|uniref:Uma2 family endonuclease n=1 Tax=Micromonospora sp. NPDC048999 TaxID=3155391 RepID=UPI0033EDE948
MERTRSREWTAEDLVDLPRDLRYELVNGRLVTLSWTPLHQQLCLELLLAVEERLPADVLASMHVSVAIDRRHELRPDLVVVRVQRANTSPVPAADVVLAVEVLAAFDSRRDLDDKRSAYAHAGVRSYWVVDPLQKRITLTEYALGAGREYEQVTHTEDLFVSERPWKVSVDLPALTARRNDLLATEGE